MTKWTKAIPKELGWYWIKYRSKHGGFSIVPCEVAFVMGENYVRIEGSGFNSETRKYFGFADARFGPRIAMPPELARDNARMNKALKREVRGTR